MRADDPGGGKPDRRRWALPVSLALVGLAGVGWLIWPDVAAKLADSAGTVRAATSAGAAGGTAFLTARPADSAGAATAQGIEAERALWAERLARARATLVSYRKASEYPFNSRPASEHADQLYPNRPVIEARPLNNGSDEADTSVEVVTSQSRVFMASGESVLFTIAAHDQDGHPLPVAVQAARAIGMNPTTNGGSRSAPVAFNDQGQAGDAQAGDGTQSATLDPSGTSLADFDGTIRVEVAFTAGGKSGRHLFDVVYSPQVPATWAGPFRDAQENGSLVLRVPVDVKQAGRYVINARVDDASGTPLALVTFNDELAAGSQPVTLTVFGKLIHDSKPTFPLQVRDVDGYLLREQGHPDRLLMPRLEGKVLTSAQYALSSFANVEWQSEQKERYLKEFGKDVAEAQQHLAALGQ
ncbi:hypothetical protein GCM10025771_39430 [Niveibacterium umoris]|uniref:Uncharacterized protein n=1 Tax=Niveibacterium umoris TaxID=1193620 RepID=A0A840BCQ1_9RHOO|nr:hypothetical protein [Niveibacterium umoris]MBB4010855.1 hypothetical protein [Niveibacterium umoris]